MSQQLTCDVCAAPVSPTNCGQTTAETVVCVVCLSRMLVRPEYTTEQDKMTIPEGYDHCLEHFE